ncbi:MAG: hypothetical protein KKG47_06810 [Proteobacteria bacterium]|nr:hypothetical protein [Pseudomonadota bacterium]MBU1739115.1 hypothetical protein [Pseudomonadota bacterium]
MNPETAYPEKMKKTDNIIQGTALLAAGFIGVQIATILFSGEAFCLNQGCKVVEELTRVPPLFVNLAGLLFFLALFVAARRPQSGPHPELSWTALLLLTGLGAEGVLVGYQVFVIHTLCSYCLIIFGVILFLNLISGRRQIFLGLSVFAASMIAFSSLNFGQSQMSLKTRTLLSGTFAKTSCIAPENQLYLFFSANCPHCQTVIKALENCNSCEMHFNPIEPIESLEHPELEHFPDYDPSLNRLVLSLLGIKTIPVMIIEKTNGFSLIKGEDPILSYINQVCFNNSEHNPYQGQTYLPDQSYGFTPEPGTEGECEIEVECPDPGQSLSPALK